MSTIAQTGSSHDRLNLRAFLAGSGATAALIAGAVIAFLAIGALFAFDDLPFGGGDDDATVVEIGAPAGPERAAAAVAGASRAVDASPAPTTTTRAAAAPTQAPVDGAVLGSEEQQAPLSSAIGTGPGSDGGGTLGDTIGGAGDEAGNAGGAVSLSDVAGDATRSLDEAVGGLGLNLGQPGPDD